ncbi:hypothetical protein IP79_13570 [Porphyrobacter sp. AAP60]|nr:hypothetical protein IP79_13570 [Porphyrobacter sp. AAP60]
MAFERPESLMMARGYQFGRLQHGPDGDYHSPDGGYNGGIIAPERILIPATATLVRFGGSAWRGGGSFVGKVAAGEWWLDWRNFKLVEQYASTIGESVAFAVRQTCAVPEEWSDLSLFIQGTSRSPLWAYTGLGDVAHSSSGTIDPVGKGKPMIRQLFIPGLADPDLRKEAIVFGNPTFLDPEMSKPGALARAREEERLRRALGGK